MLNLFLCSVTGQTNPLVYCYLIMAHFTLKVSVSGRRLCNILSDFKSFTPKILQHVGFVVCRVMLPSHHHLLLNEGRGVVGSHPTSWQKRRRYQQALHSTPHLLGLYRICLQWEQDTGLAVC